MAISRRGFVKGGVSVAALSLLAGEALPAGARAAAPGTGTGDPWLGLKIGIASYTFNRFPVDVAIAGMRRVGVSYASIKDVHMPLKSTAAERKAVVKQFRDAGIDPISCGVVTMTDDPSQLRNAFEYARDAGLPTIVCKPTRKSLPELDKLVKEFDIKLAIHNHGPQDKVWPSPLDVWEAVQDYDPRIGVCVDVGHTAHAQVDPAQAIRKCAPRLFDLHLKDLVSTAPDAEVIEVGRGVLDIRGVLRALLDIKYTGHVGLEHEKDMRDPLPGVAESIGYVRGALAGMKA